MSLIFVCTTQFLSDEALPYLVTKDKCLDREELDARNLITAPPEYYQVVADKYNDETWICETLALPELHPDFAESKILVFAEMPGGAVTALDVKNRGSDSRARVIDVSSS